MSRTIASLLMLMLAPVAAQQEPMTYHDLAAMPTWPLGNMKAKGAMGQHGSFAIGEMPPGARGRAGNTHHHAQEGIFVGVAGSSVVLMSGATYRLGVLGAVLTPPNSAHAGLNGLTSGSSTFIEFQPVLRRDWFPPHPKVDVTQTAAPVPVASEQRIFEDLDLSSNGWMSDKAGARYKELGGESVKLTMWDLSAPGLSVQLKSGNPSELFVYVFHGQLTLNVEPNTREMAAQTLAIVSPQANNVQLHSVGKGTIVGVFEARLK
jgi:hypothetical protein